MEIRNYATDVAIIGGGGAALRAAIEASEKGQKVILVDKGRPGRSGATPCALWSVQAPFGSRGQDERDSPEQFFEDMVRAGRFIGDQNLVEVLALPPVTACWTLKGTVFTSRSTMTGAFIKHRCRGKPIRAPVL